MVYPRILCNIAAGLALLMGAGTQANIVGSVGGGIFSSVVPVNNGMITPGANQVAFGSGGSALSAAPIQNEFDVPLASVVKTADFVFGTLTFHNARNAVGSEITHVTLSFSIGNDVHGTGGDSILPTWPGAKLDVMLEIDNTLNAQGVDIDDFVRIRPLNADFGIPSNYPNPCGTGRCDEFHVAEGAAATVDVWAHLGSLRLVGFGNVSDPSVAFVSSSIPDAPTLPLMVIGTAALLMAIRLSDRPFASVKGSSSRQS